MPLPGHLHLRYSDLTLQSEHESGQVYAGREFGGTPVTVAVLSETAAADPALRAAFVDAVNRYEVRASDLAATWPWAAIETAPGQPGAEQLLGLPGPLEVFGPTSASTEKQPPADAPGPLSAYQAAQLAAYRQPTDLPAAAGSPPPPATPPLPKRSRTSIAISIAAAAIVFITCCAGCLGQAGFSLRDTASEPATGQSPAPTVEPVPQLREQPAVSIVGPTWDDGNDTYTMAFPGWPFAFRTPASWGCFRGTYEPVPDAPAWRCFDETDPDSGHLVTVLLWTCPSTCTEDEQSEMIDTWLADPEQATIADTMVYVETEDADSDHYSIDVSYFIADPAAPSESLQWHVGIYAESPIDDRADILRVVNDLVGQATG